MFPTSPQPGGVEIPAGATFRMPKPEDISDNGIGAYIRNTWLIERRTCARGSVLTRIGHLAFGWR